MKTLKIVLNNSYSFGKKHQTKNIYGRAFISGELRVENTQTHALSPVFDRKTADEKQ